MRPLFCQLGVSGRCDGSANMACGKTAVTAAVFGPVEARAQKERVDSAVVDVSARLMAPSASGSALEARAREMLIRGVIEACILSAAHPRTAVHVSIHQLEEDGGTIAAMVNGSCLALLDASYPLHHLYAAVQVALIEGRVRIDPTRKELRDADCAITFVFDSIKREVLASHVEGKCSEKHFQECLATARDESQIIIDFFKESMRKKFSKEV